MPNTFPLRRVIECARKLESKQGFPRRSAIKAAIAIVGRNPEPVITRKPANAARREYALEYLSHRNHSMARQEMR